MASPEVTRWRAVEGVCVPVPGQPARHGMSVSYVGRSIDREAEKAGEKDLEKLHPIDNSDEFCAFTRTIGSSLFTELMRIAKHGDLTAGDAITAKWAGLPLPAAASAPIPSTDSAPRVPRRAPTPDTKPEAQ